MKGRLYRGMLHYRGVTLHTASSGSVSGLDTLWLHLECDGVYGTGEVRLNIRYLHGYSEQQVLDNLTHWLNALNWHTTPADMLAAVHHPDSTLLAPARMVVDIALHDLLARQQGQSLAAWLGQPGSACAFPTNQTLFWGSEQQLLDQAQHYVDRGFTQLKLRTGVADFATDLNRLTILRQHFGSAISLAIDVNGQWSPEQAQEYFPQLSPLQLSYIEQPLAPANDHRLGELSALGIPVMLDESLNSPAAITRLIEADGQLRGHLKLVKMGGIAPLMEAARQLQLAGVPFMVGQMNEGHVATAAALQVCRVLQPVWGELYGADGLTDDPACGLFYHDGTVRVAESAGLGVVFNPAQATFIQEWNYAN